MSSYIKRNALLFILVCFTVVIMINMLPGPPESHCNSDYASCNPPGSNIKEARLGFDGSRVRIDSNTIRTTRTFRFSDKETYLEIATLSVMNPRYDAPEYTVIIGSTHDWLKVTRIVGSGTSYIEYVDDWYYFDGVSMKKVLSYVSRRELVPNLNDQMNEYIYTRVEDVSPENTIIRIEITERKCSNDKDCVETSRLDTYEWSENVMAFILKEDDTASRTIDATKYASVMPVSIGAKWTYEGKRLFYDPAEKKEKEVTATKVAEVTDLENDGENLKVSVQETYTNDPEFTERKISYWISESGIASTGNNVVNFPFTKGQELFNDDPGQKRTDGLYADIVTSVGVKNILGEEYKCYDISDNTLGSTSFQTFCEGLGYVRDYYKHHGTPDEWDYKLVSLSVN